MAIVPELDESRKYLQQRGTQAADENVGDTIMLIDNVLDITPNLKALASAEGRSAAATASRLDRMLVQAEEGLRIIRDYVRIINGAKGETSVELTERLKAQKELNVQLTPTLQNLRLLSRTLRTLGEGLGCWNTSRARSTRDGPSTLDPGASPSQSARIA